MVTPGLGGAGSSAAIDVIIRGRDLTQQAFSSAGLNTKRFAAGLIAAGTIVNGFSLLALRQFAKVGDEIQKMSFRTGVGVEALSKLRFVAEQGGTDLNAFERAISGMQRAIINGQRGLLTSTDSFKRLNLTVRDFEGKDVADQMFLLIDALSKLTDETEKGALAQFIFGRAGRLLLPTISEWRTGFDRLAAEAETLGIVFNDLSADEAAELVDTMNRVTRSFNAIQFAIGAILSPYARDFLDVIVKILTVMSRWIRENKTLAIILIGIATALATLALIAGSLIIIIPLVAATLAILGVTLGTVALVALAVVLAIGSIIAAGILLIRHWEDIGEIWEAITNSMLAQALFALLTGDLEKFRESLGGAIGELKNLSNALLNLGSAFVIYVSLKFLEGIIKEAEEIWNNIKAIYDVAINPVIEFLKSYILNEAKDIWDDIKTIYDVGINPVLEFLKGLILDAARGIWTAIKFIYDVVINPVIEFFKPYVLSAATDLWKAIKIIYDVVINPVIEFFKPYVLSSAKDIWDAIKTIYNVVINPIIEFLKPYIIKAARDIWDAIKTIYDVVINPVIEFLEPYILSVAKGIWDAIKIIYDVVINPVIEFLEPYIISFAKGIWDGIKTIYDVVINPTIEFLKPYILSSAQDIWNGVKTIYDVVINPVIEFLKPYVLRIANIIWGSIKTIFDVVINPVIKFLAPYILRLADIIWNSIKTIFDVTINPVIAFLEPYILTLARSIYDKIKAIFNKTITLTINIPTPRIPDIPDVISGTASGIGGIVSGVVSGITDIIEKVVPNDDDDDGLTFDQRHGLVPVLQHGDRNFRGGAAILGEAGRELVRLPEGSEIFSNSETEQILQSQQVPIVQVFIDGIEISSRINIKLGNSIIDQGELSRG